MKKPEKEIDNILNTENNTYDQQVKGVANYIYENNVYIQLKNDLINYLSSTNSILRDLLNYRNNNAILKTKRESLNLFLNKFLESIVKIESNNIIVIVVN